MGAAETDADAASQVTAADETKRRAKLEELRRRRTEDAPRPALAAPAPAAAASAPGGDKRAMLRELLARSRENGGEGRGEFLKRALQNRIGGGSAGGVARPGNGERLRRLPQSVGGSNQEAELQERLRRLEAELQSLRSIAAGGARG